MAILKDLIVQGPARVIGETYLSVARADSFIKNGGTSAQFLKADGSVDSNTYATQTWVTGRGYTTNAGTVTSVGAGTGLSISGTASVTPTINIDSGYHLPTTTEWDAVEEVVNNSPFAEGNGVNSAEQWENQADGEQSVATGYYTAAKGKYTHTEGTLTVALGQASHAEGTGTATSSSFTITGSANVTTYTSNAAHGLAIGDVVGYGDIIAKVTAVGSTTSFTVDKTLSSSALSGKNIKIFTGVAYAENSHVEGWKNISGNNNSHAEGWLTKALGHTSHAEGYLTKAEGAASHAEGATYNNIDTSASADAAHAEGAGVVVKGQAAHGEGLLNVAGRTQEEAVAALADFPNLGGTTEQKVYKLMGVASHSEGSSTRSLGTSSHAEGNSTQALVNSTHAEGDSTTASGEAAHSEGYKTTASGNQAHAEGYNTKASANQAHAEGQNTEASGGNAHAEGKHTTAIGESSHAEGFYTVTNNNVEHAEGQFNVSIADVTRHTVGIGNSSTRKNAHTITIDGKHYIPGVGGYTGTENTVASLAGKRDLASVVKDLDDNTPYITKASLVGSGIVFYPDGSYLVCVNYMTYSDVFTYLVECNDDFTNVKVTSLSEKIGQDKIKFYTYDEEDATGLAIWCDDSADVSITCLDNKLVVPITKINDEPSDKVVVDQYVRESSFAGGAKVLMSRQFGPYTCAAASVEKGYIFFMNVVPKSDNWYEPWYITYRLKIESATAACQGYYEITVGSAGTTSHYHVFNKFYSTSYYPSYYHLMAWYNSNAKYNNRTTNPIKIGERIYSAYGANTVARTYTIEVVDIYNCEVSFPNNIETYDSFYADAKYGYCSTFNATTNGTLDNYDANSPPYVVYDYYVYYKIHDTSTPLYRYKFCGFDDKGRLVPINTTNQSSATLIDKTPTPVPMKVGKGLVYYNTTTNITTDTAVTATGTIYKFHSTFNNPWTYNFSSLPGQGKDIYLVGSYNRAKDEFTLDTTSATSFYKYTVQGAFDANDYIIGKYYWYVGCSGDHASYPNYGKLDLNNPLYYFNGRQLIPVIPGDNGPLIISPGTTTWQELKEAHESGRPILYYYSDNTYICCEFNPLSSSAYARFWAFNPAGNNYRYAQLYSNNYSNLVEISFGSSYDIYSVASLNEIDALFTSGSGGGSGSS